MIPPQDNHTVDANTPTGYDADSIRAPPAQTGFLGSLQVQGESIWQSIRQSARLDKPDWLSTESSRDAAYQAHYQARSSPYAKEGQSCNGCCCCCCCKCPSKQRADAYRGFYGTPTETDGFLPASTTATKTSGSAEDNDNVQSEPSNMDRGGVASYQATQSTTTQAQQTTTTSSATPDWLAI